MTIPQGKDAKIGHPESLEDGADNAQYAKLNVVNYKKTNKKENTYIPRPRQYSTHYRGPKTFAYDTLNVEDTWTIDCRIQNAETALSHTNMVNNNGNIDVSGESLNFSGSFDVFLPLGAPKIKYDSETVTNTTDSTTLTRGSNSDYVMDYDRGSIKIVNNSLDASDSYEIDYTTKGSSLNMARIVERMSKLGGAGSFIVFKDDFTVSGSAGAEDGAAYNVQFDNVEWTTKSDKPDETILTLDLRVAIDYEGQ